MNLKNIKNIPLQKLKISNLYKTIKNKLKSFSGKPRVLILIFGGIMSKIKTMLLILYVPIVFIIVFFCVIYEVAEYYFIKMLDKD